MRFMLLHHAQAASPADASWSEWVRALLPVVAILGATIAALLTFRHDRQSRAEERLERATNLASALYGEIDGLLNICRTEYLPGINFARRNIAKDPSFTIGPRYSSVEFFEVFRANSEALGSLPHPLPQAVSRLYAGFFALQENLRTMVQPGWDMLPPRSRVVFLYAVARRMDQLIVEGQSVQRELARRMKLPIAA